MITAKKTPPLHPADSDPPGDRLSTRRLLAPTFALGLAVLGLAGCVEPRADTVNADEEENVGSAQQAITQTCVTLNRLSYKDAVRDTYVSSGKPANSFGSQGSMLVSQSRVSLIRFDLQQIPMGAYIDSATISLRTNNVLPGHGAFQSPVRLHPITDSSWNENTVTWNTFGEHYDPNVTATFDSVVEAQSATVDVKSMIQSLVSRYDEFNHGFAIEASSAGANEAVDFGTSEVATIGARPKLTVCYLPNLCDSSACENGGKCTQSGAATSCTCPAGTSGQRCEIVADPCSPNPCRWGSTCTANGPSFTCACPSGFSGDRCQNYDVCGNYGSLICNHGSTCTNQFGSSPAYSCACPPGYYGRRCEFSSCKCANESYFWNQAVSSAGIETKPSAATVAWGAKCGGGIFTSTSRTWLPTWTFPTLIASYGYIQYLNSFYQGSPYYCNWVNPFYQSLYGGTAPGVLTVLDQPNSTASLCTDAYAHVNLDVNSTDAAACKSDIASAPHVIAQPLPDVPVTIGLGAPALLAIAELLRRRFGKKVAK